MKLYLCLQLIRLCAMCAVPGDDAGASRSCDLCKGKKGACVCTVTSLKGKPSFRLAS